MCSAVLVSDIPQLDSNVSNFANLDRALLVAGSEAIALGRAVNVALPEELAP
jgi:hypothetical protein